MRNQLFYFILTTVSFNPYQTLQNPTKSVLIGRGLWKKKHEEKTTLWNKIFHFFPPKIKNMDKEQNAQGNKNNGQQ